MNTNSLNINSDRWHRHQDLYAKDFAHHQVVLHYHHADVIIELLRQLGLKVQRMIPDSETLFIIVTNETSHY